MRNAGVPVPLVVSSATGCRLTDVEGTELLDLNMGTARTCSVMATRTCSACLADQMTHATMTGLPHALDHQAGELITALGAFDRAGAVRQLRHLRPSPPPSASPAW